MSQLSLKGGTPTLPIVPKGYSELKERYLKTLQELNKTQWDLQDCLEKLEPLQQSDRLRRQKASEAGKKGRGKKRCR